MKGDMTENDRQFFLQRFQELREALKHVPLTLPIKVNWDAMDRMEVAAALASSEVTKEMEAELADLRSKQYSMLMRSGELSAPPDTSGTAIGLCPLCGANLAPIPVPSDVRFTGAKTWSSMACFRCETEVLIHSRTLGKLTPSTSSGSEANELTPGPTVLEPTTGSPTKEDSSDVEEWWASLPDQEVHELILSLYSKSPLHEYRAKDGTHFWATPEAAARLTAMMAQEW